MNCERCGEPYVCNGSVLLGDVRALLCAACLRDWMQVVRALPAYGIYDDTLDEFQYVELGARAGSMPNLDVFKALKRRAGDALAEIRERALAFVIERVEPKRD